MKYTIITDIALTSNQLNKIKAIVIDGYQDDLYGGTEQYDQIMTRHYGLEYADTGAHDWLKDRIYEYEEKINKYMSMPINQLENAKELIERMESDIKFMGTKVNTKQERTDMAQLKRDFQVLLRRSKNAKKEQEHEYYDQVEEILDEIASELQTAQPEQYQELLDKVKSYSLKGSALEKQKNLVKQIQGKIKMAIPEKTEEEKRKEIILEGKKIGKAYKEAENKQDWKSAVKYIKELQKFVSANQGIFRKEEVEALPNMLKNAQENLKKQTVKPAEKITELNADKVKNRYNVILEDLKNAKDINQRRVLSKRLTDYISKYKNTVGMDENYQWMRELYLSHKNSHKPESIQTEIKKEPINPVAEPKIEPIKSGTDKVKSRFNTILSDLKNATSIEQRRILSKRLTDYISKHKNTVGMDENYQWMRELYLSHKNDSNNAKVERVKQDEEKNKPPVAEIDIYVHYRNVEKFNTTLLNSTTNTEAELNHKINLVKSNTFKELDILKKELVKESTKQALIRSEIHKDYSRVFDIEEEIKNIVAEEKFTINELKKNYEKDVSIKEHSANEFNRAQIEEHGHLVLGSEAIEHMPKIQQLKQAIAGFHTALKSNNKETIERALNNFNKAKKQAFLPAVEGVGLVVNNYVNKLVNESKIIETVENMNKITRNKK